MKGCFTPNRNAVHTVSNEFQTASHDTDSNENLTSEQFVCLLKSILQGAIKPKLFSTGFTCSANLLSGIWLSYIRKNSIILIVVESMLTAIYYTALFVEENWLAEFIVLKSE